MTKPYHYTYVLDGHEPVPCDATFAAIQWWHDHLESDCRVGRTDLHDGALCVYTTFLGRNHDFTGVPGAAPVLFETMIHDERADSWWGEQWRYSTWDEAEEGHARAVEYVRRKVAGEPIEDAPVHVGLRLERLMDALDDRSERRAGPHA